MRWLREDGQWLLAGLLVGIGGLSACLFIAAFASLVLGVRLIPLPVPPPPTALPTRAPLIPPTPTVLPGATPAPTRHDTATPLPPPTPSQAEPSGLIVYTCFHGGFDNICALDAGDPDPQFLTNVPATDFYPEISPSGDLITFSSNRSGDFRIYLMDLNGENVRQVGPNAGSHFAPDISPDGAQIVFTNAIGRYQNIWIMNVDGSDAQPLTIGPHNDVDPAWSPDGRQIAFASDRGWRPAHWIMDADGDNMRMLPDEVAEHGGRSDWSPDGRWLAFYAGPRERRDVYTVAANGTGEWQRLTFNGRNLAPAYSPDGAWIVFTSYRAGDNANLFIMRPNGGDVRQLTTDPNADWQPRWGP